MRRAHVLPLFMVVSGLLLACGVAAVGRAAQGPVYSIAEIRGHLEHEPRAWLGHTVLVRALVQGCPFPPYTRTYSCPPTGLEDGGVSANDGVLRVAWAGVEGLRASLRRIPLLDWLVPAPQALHWGIIATYRIQLRRAAAKQCGGASCYEALLLDAAPGSPRDRQR